jgi:hypothetical protein
MRASAREMGADTSVRRGEEEKSELKKNMTTTQRTTTVGVQAIIVHIHFEAHLDD